MISDFYSKTEESVENFSLFLFPIKIYPEEGGRRGHERDNIYPEGVGGGDMGRDKIYPEEVGYGDIGRDKIHPEGGGRRGHGQGQKNIAICKYSLPNASIV